MSALLNFFTLGKSDGIPLIFLHGFLGSNQDWMEITKQLDDELFCILIDLPGHGSNRQLLHYGWQETAEAIIAVMDELSLQQAGIMGYSMGGRLALYSVLYDQKRFSFLIIESATPGLRVDDSREARRLWENKIVHQLLTVPFPSFLKEWYAQPLFAAQSRHPDLQQFLTRRFDNDPLALATVFQNFAASTQPDLWPQLGKLNLPLLLMAGKKDLKYQQILRQFQISAPQASLEILEDCGHHIHFEQPVQFASKIRSFIHSVFETTI